jgi:T5SS/PEP-CTERM-associated repeat protein
VAALLALPSLSIAAITATGDVNPNPPTPGSLVEIGRNDVGMLTIDGGSTLDSNDVEIGLEGIGYATVRGLGSQWTSDLGLYVGGFGIGRLEILEGAIVTSGFAVSPSSGTTVGAPEGNGTIVVNGLGSILRLGGPLSVGSDFGGSGFGTLKIVDQAIVDAEPEVITSIGPRGRIELNDGLFRTGRLENQGTIIGSGEIQIIDAVSFQDNTGRIEAGPGDRLAISGPYFDSPLTNSGVMAADGGELEFFSPIMMVNFFGIGSPQMTLRDGVIRFPSDPFSPDQGGLMKTDGTLAAIGGENNIYGPVVQYQDFIADPGQIVVTNNSVLIFHDPVNIMDGDFVVHPGSNVIFLDDFQMNGVLQLTVGSGVETIPLQLGAGAALGGQIDVQLAGGYTPQAGDAFTLVTGGQIDGTLLPVDMPELPSGLLWDWNYSPTEVELAVVAGLLGDYNDNGTVDAPDYTMWRDAITTGAADLANDPTPGTIDESDFDYWRAHFGETLGNEAGAGAAAAVPEPATIVTLCVGLALAPLFRARRRMSL